MSTIPARVHRNAEQFGDRPALSLAGNTITWRDVQLRIAQIAQGLTSLGVDRGDRVALMISDRPEHWLADQAAVHIGAVPTTVYATMPSSQVAFVAQHSRSKVAILEGADQVGRWLPVLGELPEMRHVVVLDPDALVFGDDRFVAWSEIVVEKPDLTTFESTWRAIAPDDPAALIYTSGTTGVPKGVVLTHLNLIANVESLDAASHIPGHFSNVCYLPLAHIAERVVSIYMPILKAGHVTFCPDPNQLLGVLVQTRPNLFFGVPRVWEKLKAGLSARPEATLANVGLDRVEWAFSAGAPLSLDVQEYFRARGIPILEGFGMTETTGVATTTSIEELRLGSVGRATTGNEIKLLEDGEVLIRGPIVCAGYLQESGSVEPATDAEGWMHTGDVGRLDADGFLSIIDRKKELIITSGGKNIAPVAIESLLKRHALVGEALAYGDRRPYVVALIVLDPETAPAWAASRGITYSSLAELSEHPDVLAEIGLAVAAANEELARVEQVKTFHMLPTEWTVDSGELTPSLKMKRRVVQDKYHEAIEALYAAG